MGEAVDWERFGMDIAGKVIYYVELWCLAGTDEPELACVEKYVDMGLYDLAGMFQRLSLGITEEDLKLLEQMPRDIYAKYDEYVRKSLKKLYRELLVEIGSECEEYCLEYECDEDDDECMDECMEECMYE
jgi:hypothetical protein